MTATTREKMVGSTVLLLREYGLTGTSVRDVVEHSGAPRGSIYHHFPDGKVQMVEEAVAFAGDSITAAIERVADDVGPIEALASFIEIWRQVLIASDFRAGCPVVAVAAEVQEDPAENTRLAKATAAVFSSWTGALADGFVGLGVDRTRAKSLSTLMIASIEGAVVICRAQRSTAALDDVGSELTALVEAAV